MVLPNQIVFIMRYLYTLTVITGFLMCSCEGPEGPQGPAGADGVDAESSYVFEWENVNFTSPDYAVLLSYPSDFVGLDTDVALVYLLWGVDESTGLDIWRPLSQTILTTEGSLIYNYDFTKYDVNLFLDAEFSLDLLGAEYTDAWVVRVVVVPGNYWTTIGGVVPEYAVLEKTFNLQQSSPNISDYPLRDGMHSLD